MKSNKMLITYDCPACMQDCARTEGRTPACFCGNAKGLIERKREPLTREAMTARMQLVADRLMNNLAKAYDNVGPTEETQLLETLITGQGLQRALIHMLH